MTAPAPAVPTWLARRAWQRRDAWALLGVVAAGLLVRAVLLPASGFIGDIDQFVDWVRHISTAGLPNAYDAHLSFGPVMVYAWWLLGVLDPNVATAVSSADPAVRIVMKLPAIAADLALAGLAWYALRHRPGWATVAVAVVLLHPGVWFISAWWGQYDSVYTAFGVAAFVFAIRNRDILAVVALALAVMTKPQAAPLVVPFAAWYLARAGWRTPAGGAVGRAVARLAVLAAVGLATIALLWLPFLAAGGPQNYVYWLGRYQGEFYALLSISAWNLWWPMQEILANGKFILDSAPLAGGVSFRLAGYLLTGLLLLGVALAVARRPTPRVLALGLATAALVAFTFLTTMHERYAFAVVPLLVFLLDDRRLRWVAVAFGVTFTLNLLAATEHYLWIVAFHGPLTVLGSVVNVGLAVFLVLETLRASRDPEPGAMINEAGREPVARTPPSTSAGSAAATSGA